MAQIQAEYDPSAIGLVVAEGLDLTLPAVLPDRVIDEVLVDSVDLSGAIFVPQDSQRTKDEAPGPPFYKAGYLSRGDWQVLDRYGHPRPPAHLLFDADAQ